MKHLCKLTSWAAIMLAVATLTSCTKEQSELSIDDIKGRATIMGSLCYSEGQAFNNNQFEELLQPAAGVTVAIKIANSSLDPNGNAQGMTTYETTTDSEGKYSIQIPVVDNTQITIQPTSFIGQRTLVTDWNNNAPVFETEEVIFNITGMQETVSPGDIIAKDNMYSFTPRDFVEPFGEVETLNGKIGIGKLYQDNTQRYWDVQSGINVIVTVTYNYTEEGSDMVRTFGATTNALGEFSVNIPVKEKGETLKRLTIVPVSFYYSGFVHYTGVAKWEELDGVYELGGTYSGVYTNFTFPTIENITRIVYASMVFTGLDGTYTDYNWNNVEIWDTEEFNEE